MSHFLLPQARMIDRSMGIFRQPSYALTEAVVNYCSFLSISILCYYFELYILAFSIFPK